MDEPCPSRIGQVIKGYDRVAYDWYPLLEGVELDGWRIGLITGSFPEREGDAIDPASWGDAYVVAPDDQRAGVVWMRGEPASVSDLGGVDPEADRFGVFQFVTPTPPTSRASAAAFLAQVLPPIREAWERQSGGSPVVHDAE